MKGYEVKERNYHSIGELKAAKHMPTVVKPDEPLADVMALMERCNFSQLPVTTIEGDVQGVISWKSISITLASGRECRLVSDCMDADLKDHQKACIDDRLLDSVEVVSEHDYVLVEGKTGELTGIVTASDFTVQFKKLAEPFLDIEEIELRLRDITRGRFSAEEAKRAGRGDRKRYINSTEDLGLGDFHGLLDDEGHWGRLDLTADREKFVERLKSAWEIRNKVMHFDAGGLSLERTKELKDTVQYLYDLTSSAR